MSNEMRVLGEGRFLRLVDVNSWEYCERIVGSAVVVIVARTGDGDVLFVEQFRPALKANVIEFPAGLVGDAGSPDESKEDAVVRELEEETGFRPSRVEFLTEGPTSAGLSSEQVAFYRAHELVKTGPGGGDGNERITVHAVPHASVRNWLASRADSGILVDPKVYAGLYFLECADA